MSCLRLWNVKVIFECVVLHSIPEAFLKSDSFIVHSCMHIVKSISIVYNLSRPYIYLLQLLLSDRTLCI